MKILTSTFAQINAKMTGTSSSGYLPMALHQTQTSGQVQIDGKMQCGHS